MRLLVIALFLLAAGCSATPPAWPGPNPSDPDAPAARLDRGSSLGSYTSRRPVNPGSWREQNERVTPAPKQ